MKKPFVAGSTGTSADLRAKVQISLVHNGYFSDPANMEAFVRVGIEPIEPRLPKKLTYIDVGGGEGDLTKTVVNYLQQKGHEVTAIVLDANENYLKKAKEKGLSIQLGNIQETKYCDIDLITMRAVIHYNEQPQQLTILKTIHDWLSPNGFLVHQLTSGNQENCALRSAIVNLSSLKRTSPGKLYHWTSEDEYQLITSQANFSETIRVGEAPPNAWGPEEQWERMHQHEEKLAKQKKNKEKMKKLREQKKQFLKEAYDLIHQYAKRHGYEKLGLESLPGKKITIHYTYPIYISHR